MFVLISNQLVLIMKQRSIIRYL